jgi:putative tricarboxylic transport membrane protein
MTIQRLDQLVALGLTLLGVYLIIAGFDYGFMRDKTPGAGFFPVLIGGIVAVLSLINLVRSLVGIEILKTGMPKGDVLRFMAVAAAMLVYVWLAPVIGLALATMALMIVVGLVIRPTLERSFLARLLAVSIVCSLACVWIFGSLLGVPILKGPFGF